MNELAVIFNRLEIDTLEVLQAAETKWNFLPFRPGLVGGHCIGVDPYYLTHKAEMTVTTLASFGGSADKRRNTGVCCTKDYQTFDKFRCTIQGSKLVFWVLLLKKIVLIYVVLRFLSSSKSI